MYDISLLIVTCKLKVTALTTGLTRIRHEGSRRRTLTVVERQQLSPHYLMIRFACVDFEGFESLSEDDHIKLLLDGEPEANGRPPMRDYTPRRWDRKAGTFDIEFALHDDPGPATAWAIGAQPGDKIEIGGPRGSVVIGDVYDWYWLIGDEAALPAIGRFLETRPDATVHVTAAVANADEEIQLAVSASQTVTWVHRPAVLAHGAETLLEAVSNRAFPIGDGFIWIAAEANVAKAIRSHVEAHGHPLDQLKAKGYWSAAGELED
jgi:NADPH-dependent ferric siderophore reductase